MTMRKRAYTMRKRESVYPVDPTVRRRRLDAVQAAALERARAEGEWRRAIGAAYDEGIAVRAIATAADVTYQRVIQIAKHGY